MSNGTVMVGNATFFGSPEACAAFVKAMESVPVAHGDECKYAGVAEGVTVYRPGYIADEQWLAAAHMLKNFADANLDHYSMPYDCPFCGVKAGG